MIAFHSTGPLDSPSGESRADLSSYPEISAAILCLLAYAALLLWVFGVAERRDARSLPHYTLCLFEHQSLSTPSSVSCQ